MNSKEYRKIYSYGSKVSIKYHDVVDMIIDIKVTNGTNCPQYYDPAFNNIWPGTVEGCYCKTNVGVWEYLVVLRKGSCREAEMSLGCVKVQPYSQVPFYFWKQELRICVRKLTNYNFYSNRSVIKEMNVLNESNFVSKTCSGETAYQIEVIQQIFCPITSLSNISSGLSEPIPVINFSLSREDNYPIVGFRMSEYNFCEIIDQDNISPGRSSNYILEKVLRTECQTTDARTILLDQLTQDVFFANNPKINHIIQNLPAYPLPDDSFVFKLGYLRYPAWTSSCRVSTDYNLYISTSYLTLSSLSLQFSTFNFVSLSFVILNDVAILYFLVSMIMQLRMRYTNKTLYLKAYEINKMKKTTLTKKSRSAQFLKFLVVESFCLALMVTLAVFYSQVLTSNNWYQSSQDCTDNSMLTWIQAYNNYMQNTMKTLLHLIFTLIGLIILDILYFLFRLWKGDLEQEEKLQIAVEEKISEDKEVQSIKTDDKVYNSGLNITEENLRDNENCQIEIQYLDLIITQKTNLRKNTLLLDETLTYSEYPSSKDPEE